MKPLANGMDSGYTFGITGGDTMSKAISVKLDEKIFKEAERNVRMNRTNRNAYVNAAIRLMNQFQERRRLEEQLRKEVEMSREDTIRLLDELRHLDAEGLDNAPW
jgi:hypothetical protein